MKLEGQPVRSPISKCEQRAAWLGRGLRIDYVVQRITYAIEWTRADAPEMIWLEDSRALLFSASKGKRVGKGESAIFREWHQRAPKSEYALELADATWIKVGRIAAIDYWSNKWGDSEEYTHDVGPTSWLYAASNGVLLAKGKLNTTNRGLVG